MKEKVIVNASIFAIITMMIFSEFVILSVGYVAADQETDYLYVVNDGKVTITGYVGSGGDILLPSILGGNPVVAIGDSAFYHCESLSSIVIPSSIIYIGNASFYKCTNLTSLTIPGNVISLGNSAFNDCSSIRSLTILFGVTDIGESAFANFKSLTSVTIPGSVTSIGKEAFAWSFSIAYINFTGPIAPMNVSDDWIAGSGAIGHAYSASNFPPPGEVWHGLYMGEPLDSETLPDTPTGLTAIAGNRYIVLDWVAPNFTIVNGVDYYIVYQNGLDVMHVIDTSASIIDLINGRSYSFAVVAHNNIGNSPISSSITISPTETIPSEPINVSTNQVDSGIGIFWSSPSNDGGYPIQSYSLYRKSDNTVYSLLQVLGQTSTNFTDYDVFPGVSYYYYLIATNKLGNSNPSQETPPIESFSLIQIRINGKSEVNSLGLISTFNGEVRTIKNNSVVSGLKILISYSVTEGSSWENLALVTTLNNGEFYVSWMPPVTGIYLIRATWEGNNQYPYAETEFSMAVTISPDKSVFTVESNSTISNLQFDSLKKELSFTVSGISGTMGYTEIVISKELIANGSDIFLSMDGKELNYQLSSTNSSWILYFTYHHSSHNVVADLDQGDEYLEGDYTYVIFSNGATIVDYAGNDGEIAIPSELGGYAVVAIGAQAFRYATSLTIITIPESVKSIGDAPFIGCSSLTTIQVNLSNPNYASIDGVLYDKNITILIQCPETKLDSFIIPDSVTTIGGHAFEDCTSLTNITIPGSVDSIGELSFAGCVKLTSITFQGNAPSCHGGGDEYWLYDHNDNLTIYYYQDATGFTTPTWQGIPTKQLFESSSDADMTMIFVAIGVVAVVGLLGTVWYIRRKK